jgi:hypothetical protein
MIDAMKQALEALKAINEMSKPPMNIPLAAEIDDAMDALRKIIQEATLQEMSDIGQEIEQWDTSDMAHRSGGLSVEQEPVAWMRDDGTLLFADGNVFAVGQAFYTAPVKQEIEQEPVVEVQSFGEKQVFVVLKPLSDGDKLYTAPPKREWVGLTDEEIWKDDAIMAANSGYGANFETLREIIKAIEAKLKEKNNASSSQDGR